MNDKQKRRLKIRMRKVERKLDQLEVAKDVAIPLIREAIRLTEAEAPQKIKGPRLKDKY